METETDVNNIIAAIEGRLVYNSIVGQVPWLHPLPLWKQLRSLASQFHSVYRDLELIQVHHCFYGKAAGKVSEQRGRRCGTPRSIGEIQTLQRRRGDHG